MFINAAGSYISQQKLLPVSLCLHALSVIPGLFDPTRCSSFTPTLLPKLFSALRKESHSLTLHTFLLHYSETDTQIHTLILF